jgi:hypothetical protein
MRQTHIWTLALCTLGFCVSGCAQWSTYPPIETTQALTNRPASRPIPAIMATSYIYVRESYMHGEDAAINLPEGTPAQAYEAVLAKLGGGQPMMRAGEPTIHIQEVRTRGFDAQTDLIYQKSDGFYEMVTLTLRGNLMEKYQVVSAHEWQLPNLAAPSPNYVAPPPAPVEHAQASATATKQTEPPPPATLDVHPIELWRTAP